MFFEMMRSKELKENFVITYKKNLFLKYEFDFFILRIYHYFVHKFLRNAQIT